ncbi:helix-turn-helix transcriptional regulator [Cohnella sp. LGH]|uniref:helix-turn-helix domain-containing protein n=1 Tax=Cohnella sp. LGH TaxID=1619153 RepID=UPI001ADC3D8E|nr:helix-turn-helix transcriptional regulator [Cohnella sp. LGH]QTH42866.1 helix-turn-helix transcriptional regulator [Cohnella sp. LGH]
MFTRIRALREDKDWTQKYIADLLKVSQTTYSRYESGELDLPTSSLIKLADLHQTSIDYLLNRTDRKEPYPPKKK